MHQISRIRVTPQLIKSFKSYISLHRYLPHSTLIFPQRQTSPRSFHQHHPRQEKNINHNLWSKPQKIVPSSRTIKISCSWSHLIRIIQRFGLYLRQTIRILNIRLNQKRSTWWIRNQKINTNLQNYLWQIFQRRYQKSRCYG